MVVVDPVVVLPVPEVDEPVVDPVVVPVPEVDEPVVDPVVVPVLEADEPVADPVVVPVLVELLSVVDVAEGVVAVDVAVDDVGVTTTSGCVVRLSACTPGVKNGDKMPRRL